MFLILQPFWWPPIKKDASESIAVCPSNEAPVGLLQPLLVPKHPDRTSL